jgi:hypothetical protein
MQPIPPQYKGIYTTMIDLSKKKEEINIPKSRSELATYTPDILKKLDSKQCKGYFAAFIEFAKHDGEHCPIGQVPLSWGAGAPDYKVVILPCTHFFHYSAIDEWALTSTTCPTCKQKFEYVLSFYLANQLQYCLLG